MAKSMRHSGKNAEDAILQLLLTKPSFFELDSISAPFGEKKGLTEQAITAKLAHELNTEFPKSAVREALIILEAKGYIERGHYGAHRHDIPVPEFANLHALWLKLENDAIERIIESRTHPQYQGQIGEITRLANIAEKAEQAGDLLEWVKADIAMHKEIFKTVNQNEYGRIIEPIIMQTRIQSQLMDNPEGRKAIIERNKRLTTLLYRGNSQDASKALEDCIATSFELCEKTFPSFGAKIDFWSDAQARFGISTAGAGPARV